MNCERFQEKLHEHYMDRLPESELPELELHAAGCADCKELMGTAAALSCMEFIEFLNEYVDDELGPDRRTVFERHLAICPDCTAYLDSYRKTMALSIAAMTEGPFLPGGPPPELIRAILDARGG